jgi:hypothetical protein
MPPRRATYCLEDGKTYLAQENLGQCRNIICPTPGYTDSFNRDAAGHGRRDVVVCVNAGSSAASAKFDSPYLGMSSGPKISFPRGTVECIERKILEGHDVPTIDDLACGNKTPSMMTTAGLQTATSTTLTNSSRGNARPSSTSSVPSVRSQTASGYDPKSEIPSPSHNATQAQEPEPTSHIADPATLLTFSGASG